MEDFPISQILSVLVPIIVLWALIAGITSRYRRVAPNTAMVVFGQGKTRIVKGGGTIVWPVISEARTLSLNLITIDIVVRNVYTLEGVPVTVDGVAQVKIGGDDELIATAAEQLLGKQPQEVHSIALQSLEGHLRGTLGKLTVEKIYQDREAFSQEVQKQATNDMAGMGLKIVSLTIKSVTDDQGYLDALGRKRTAEVKRDAEIGQAEATRESRERVAAATQAAKEAELEADARIAEAEKSLAVQQAGYKTEADTAKAKADLAFDLQDAEIRRDLATRNGAVAIEQQKQAALAAAEAVQVAEKTKQAEVVVPANAQRQATIETATADAEKTRLAAGAEAERVRQTRTAEAEGIRAVGTAEADAQKAKLLAEAEGESQLAAARSAQGEVNLRQFAIEQVINGRVAMVRAMADSMAHIGAEWKIVQFGGGSGSNGQGGNMVRDNLAMMPEIFSLLDAQTEALTGMGLKEVLTQVGDLVRGTRTVDATPTEPQPALVDSDTNSQQPESEKLGTDS